MNDFWYGLHDGKVISIVVAESEAGALELARDVTSAVERVMPMCQETWRALGLPVPAHAAGKLVSVRLLLGKGLPAFALTVTTETLDRYADVVDPIPDDLAGRARTLFGVLYELRGCFEPDPFRQWLERPQEALNGHTPRELLATGDEEQHETVVALADRSLQLRSASEQSAYVAVKQPE